MQTLLVIDDEASIRYSIQDVLESEELRVLCSENAVDGLSVVGNEFLTLCSWIFDSAANPVSISLVSCGSLIRRFS